MKALMLLLEKRMDRSAHADGTSIKPSALDGMISKNQHAFDVVSSHSGQLSFFEVLTALAAQHFAEQAVDWAIMEAGLGGITDATNVFASEQVVPWCTHGATLSVPTGQREHAVAPEWLLAIAQQRIWSLMRLHL